MEEEAYFFNASDWTLDPTLEGTFDPRFDPTSMFFEPKLYFALWPIDAKSSILTEDSGEGGKRQRNKRLLIAVFILITISFGVAVGVKTGIFCTALKKLILLKGSKTVVKEVSKLPVLRPPVYYLNILQDPLNRFSTPANFSQAEILFERAEWVKILLEPEKLPRPKYEGQKFVRSVSADYVQRTFVDETWQIL